MPEWTIEGPIEGGRGQAFIQPPFDCAAVDYEEKEYVIAGTAAQFRFASGAGMSPDGQWQVEQAGTVPYRTRIVVRRPRDSARFNGTVILLWNNVTAGFDNIRTHPHMYEDGFAIVAASLQRVGIEGFAGTDPKGLLAFDSERYHGLSLPTDDASYDILTQVGHAVGPERHCAIDPLAGLPVRHVIARGASQSAARLATYINAIAPLGHPFSGFMLDVFMGTPAPLETADTALPQSIDDLATLIDGTCAPGTSRMRDIGVPIFVVNSESESRSYASVRQPDNDRYRLWEAAGLSHAGGIRVSSAFTSIDWPPNIIDIQPFRDAALHCMQQWVRDGVPPPVQPRIELEPAGPGIPPRVVRDEFGIARGGIRLPEVAVPTAAHSGFNTPGWAFLRGSSPPLTSAQLHALYADHDDYVRKVEQAGKAAVEAGVLLPNAAHQAVLRAKAENPMAEVHTIKREGTH